MILVAGATGSLGGRIARDLLARGEAVRALVRPVSDPAALAGVGAGIATGDLRDPSSLQAACAGVHVVVSTASATGRTDDTPENVDGQGNRNLIHAARGAGVRHFILVSTVGASLDSPVPAFRAKGVAEAALRESGLTYTILHPAGFMDVWFGMLVEGPIAAGQPVTLVGESRRRHSFIAERDVAAFVLAAMHNQAGYNATLPIGGPAAVTLTEVVRAYEAALGRPIPVRSVAPGQPIPGLPEAVWPIAASLEANDLILPMDETAKVYGVDLTSVEEFARGRIGARL